MKIRDEQDMLSDERDGLEKILDSKARLKTLNDPAERKAEMKVLADLQMRLAMEKEAYRRFG